jgi:hypothetical protein
VSGEFLRELPVPLEPFSERRDLPEKELSAIQLLSISARRTEMLRACKEVNPTLLVARIGIDMDQL